jgi:hypothetical protein
MDADTVKNVVREWVRMDNEIRALNRELSSCRKEKKKMSEALVQIMRENSLDQVNLTDGQLMYVKKNVKQAITPKVLMTLLSAYFEGSTEKANVVGTYIMDNRQDSVKESIKRKISPSSSSGPSSSSVDDSTNV